MDENQVLNQHDICDEKTSITGGKSVAEVIQLLRTNPIVKFSKGHNNNNDDDDLDDQPKSNQAFPWMGKCTELCKQVTLKPNIKNLDELVSQFLKHVSQDVKQCYKKPKRANKLRLEMIKFLTFFHMIYWEIKKPLEHTSYLDKMSDILAHYIDVEMKSSRRGREHPRKISERITMSLFLFLDKSSDHMLDTVLKAKFFVRQYSEICVPVMARLLNDNPGQMYETTYVRYLLSFKLWKKLAGKDHYVNINKEAVTKLKPPPEFAEKLKGGLFSNVLPYVSKSEKDRLTLFFMRSPFNVKKKAQLFLKDERRVHTSSDLDKVCLIKDDIDVIDLIDDDSQEDENNPDVINEVWNTIMENESESCSLDDLFNTENLIEEEKIIIDWKKTNTKEISKKISKEKTNGILKGNIKKRKPVKFNSCISVKNVLIKESSEIIRTDKTKSFVPVSSKEDHSFASVVKSEENCQNDEKSSLHSSHGSEIIIYKPQKPCATVEPEQCKEVEPDSQRESKKEVIIKSPHKHPCNGLETLCRITEDNFKMNSENSARKLTVNTEEHNIRSTDNIEVESVHSETVDSSGIFNDVKVETNSQEIVVVSNIFKGDEIPIVEDQFVAEEVVIGTDLCQDDVCADFIIIDENMLEPTQQQHNIMSQNKQDMQTEIGSLLENQNYTNGINQIKGNDNKEQPSVSPENLIHLTDPDNSYVPFDNRRNVDFYNDMLLTRILSEVSVDDGSDEDNRSNSHSRYAGGGKIPAFREQIEESKSDVEEFESPSPCNSQKSIVGTSPDVNHIQSSHADVNSEDDKSSCLAPVKAVTQTQPPVVLEPKSVSPPIREVSVSLPYISELGNLSDYLNKEKIIPKVKQSSSRQSSSHHKRKRAEKKAEEQEPLDSDDDDVPLFCLDRQAEETGNKSSKEKTKSKYNKTRSTSSSRSKSKNSQPSPTVNKASLQPVKKKRRSKRKRC